MNFVLNTTIILSVLLLNNPVFSENLKISQMIWNSLSEKEKDIVADKNIIEVYDSNRYGKIINVQSVNESYYNNGGMSKLGSAFGQANYLDNTNWGNYSAENQLGAGLAGALIGAMLDKPTQIKFHSRYTIRLNNGDIITKDITQQSQFNLSSDICVEIDSLIAVNDKFCSNINVDVFKKTFLGYKDRENIIPITKEKNSIKHINKVRIKAEKNQLEKIMCKIGTSAPFKTSTKKCKLIQGEIIK